VVPQAQGPRLGRHHDLRRHPAGLRRRGALAFEAHIGLNKDGDKPIVVATNQLGDIAHSIDEVAFVFAHEFAHLELGHPKKLNDQISKLFDEWSKTKDPDYWNTLKPGQANKEFRAARSPRSKTYQEELASFQSAMEDQADLRGRELMKTAGFKEEGAVAPLQHAHEYMQARLTAAQLAEISKQVQDHRPPAERAKGMAEENAQMCLKDGPCQ